MDVTELHILADGGWCIAPEQKYSPAAFVRALEAGFGIFVPIRDSHGSLVISAGPPDDRSVPLNRLLGDLPVWPGRIPSLALHIGSEGLSPLIRRALSPGIRLNPYVTGMSVPETLAYLDGHIPVFVRQSEHERTPALYELAEGVWLDTLERSWYDERLILSHMRAGKVVAVVSHDLRGLPHIEQWQMLKGLVRELGENARRLELCTGMPSEARDFFSQ